MFKLLGQQYKFLVKEFDIICVSSNLLIVSGKSVSFNLFCFPVFVSYLVRDFKSQFGVAKIFVFMLFDFTECHSSDFQV